MGACCSTALKSAIQRNDVAAVNRLCGTGVNLDSPKFLVLCPAPEAALALIAHGAAVNGAVGDGRTPLHRWVGGYEWSKVVSQLLVKGADVHALDKGGADGRGPMPPLMAACRHTGSAAILTELIEAGADVHGVYKNPNAPATPLTCMAWHACVALEWKLRGIGPDRTEAALDMLRVLLDAGADVNATDGSHDAPTALHILARGGVADGTDLLLQRGADPRATAGGRTPLQYALQGPFHPPPHFKSHQKATARAIRSALEGAPPPRRRAASPPREIRSVSDASHISAVHALPGTAKGEGLVMPWAVAREESHAHPPQQHPPSHAASAALHGSSSASALSSEGLASVHSERSAQRRGGPVLAPLPGRSRGRSTSVASSGGGESLASTGSPPRPAAPSLARMEKDLPDAFAAHGAAKGGGAGHPPVRTGLPESPSGGGATSRAVLAAVWASVPSKAGAGGGGGAWGDDSGSLSDITESSSDDEPHSLSMFDMPSASTSVGGDSGVGGRAAAPKGSWTQAATPTASWVQASH